ncbi:hypothetical protein M0R72_05065 [Candidatus Pacearchaeota archaeon]|jgi:hypothetical protein|nr:hypothetical protein [Candidatus Pacearchaeota archaeon]
MNKRGQTEKFSLCNLLPNRKGDTNWVLIMLILGIIVLVVLASGFVIGWNKFLPWLSSDNIDTVVTQCQVACATNSQYGFCSQNRTVNDGDKDIATDVSCFVLASQYPLVGVADCSQVTCPTE